MLLNSEGWRGRVTGCLVVGRLHQRLSRDLAHRLSFLMWEDANREVRLAAAQALGKAGEAKVKRIQASRFIYWFSMWYSIPCVSLRTALPMVWVSAVP